MNLLQTARDGLSSISEFWIRETGALHHKPNVFGYTETSPHRILIILMNLEIILIYNYKFQDVSRLYQEEDKSVKVTLIESKKILGAFDARLQSYAEKKFRERKNFNLVNGSVTEVTENGVKLQDGSFLPAGLVVWSTGLAPREFTKNLKALKTQQGQVSYILEFPDA